MKKIICVAIQVLAVVMFIGGIIMCFIAKRQAWDAEIESYYTRNASAVSMWNEIFILSVISVINSVFVYGFSYIVEAACLYIEKCKAEEYVSNEEE